MKRKTSAEKQVTSEDVLRIHRILEDAAHREHYYQNICRIADSLVRIADVLEAQEESR